MKKPVLRVAAAALAVTAVTLLGLAPAAAITPVSGSVLVPQAGTPSTVSTTTGVPCGSGIPVCGAPVTVNYGSGNSSVVTSYAIGGRTFEFVPTAGGGVDAGTITALRVPNATVTTDRQIIWSVDTGTHYNVLGSDPGSRTMFDVLSDNVLTDGADNVFANAGGANVNNIERLDVKREPFSTIDPAGTGVIIAERGGNDAFKMAAITAVAGDGTPTAFGPVLPVTVAAWGGAANLIPSVSSTILRKDVTDTVWHPSDTSSGQNIRGIYISLAELGITAGQTVYGIALVGNDETSMNPPTWNLTTDANTTGGLDLVAAQFVTTPSIALDKTVTPTTAAAVGDSIAYTFHVTNTGLVPLTSVTVTETAFSGTGTLGAITCGPTSIPNGSVTLAPGAEIDCTAAYTLTLADVVAGQVTNTATTNGTPPAGPPVVSPPDDGIVTIPPAPAIALDKTVSPTTALLAGETITYTFHVTNTGNLPLTAVTVTETAFSGTGTLGAITCGPTSIPNGSVALAIGAEIDCTASYQLTPADVTAGQVTNTATATGTPPSGPPVVSPPDDGVVDIPTPSIALEKTVDPTTAAAVGDVVTYTFHVTNTGEVALTDVAVNETAFSGTGTLGPIACGPTSIPNGAVDLGIGGEIDCTATYALTLADVVAGQVTNTATSSGFPPAGPPVVSPPDDGIVTIPPSPAITLDKSVDPTTAAAVGQTITYTFHVANTGNLPLTNVTVNETAFSGTGTLGAITCGLFDIPNGDLDLAIGAETDCIATYQLTVEDALAGEVTNTATVSGTPPDGPPVVSPPDDGDVIIPPTPAIALEKTADPTTAAAVGDTITYTFHVTNTGNLPLTNVTVVEGVFSGTGTLGPITCGPDDTPNGDVALAAGEDIDCTATYQLTAADVAAGEVTNTATDTGTPPDGPPVVSPPDDGDVVIPPPSPTPAPAPPSGGGLSETGGAVPVIALIVGIGAVLAGFALTSVRRRSRS
ncbi:MULTISPECIES: beta strand repeat-containing protein [unclassified Microbacterium]|uniref:beta strand repeat-containing protein n=1 Tax=unclassified Microbacterium TaxID=2609290 RepID=UPI00301A32F5